MKIIVFGARGDVGSRIVGEALRRGHQVTAAVRSSAQSTAALAGVETVVADASDTAAVADLIKEYDLAISAVRPPDGKESDLVPLTASILSAAARTGTRVLIVGGAASLRLPDAPIHTVLTAPNFLPEPVVPIARASFAQYETAMAEVQADWTYVSPPAMLVPGERTGQYRVGGDTLLVDGNGQSQISMEDFSVALLDEAENPHHRQARFTVAN